jgi:hypothetical protein
MDGWAVECKFAVGFRIGVETRYRVVTACEPREEGNQAACRFLGKRLAE